MHGTPVSEVASSQKQRIRFARHFDIDGDFPIIPAARTKTGNEHRVPQTDEMRSIITEARADPGQELLFPSPTGKVLSDATMGPLHGEGRPDYRPQGFRATFRTWAEENTSAHYEAKETVLAHKVGSNVERAYQRSDLLEKRRELLEKWADFLIRSN